MSERDDGLGAFLAGLFMGGLLGAAAALLLAPQSGEDTRTYIKDKSIELKDKAAVTYDDYYTRAGELAESTKMKATDLGQKISVSETSSEAPPTEDESVEIPGDTPEEASA